MALSQSVLSMLYVLWTSAAFLSWFNFKEVLFITVRLVLWFQTTFSCITFAGMTCFSQKLLHHLEFIHSCRELQFLRMSLYL
jgi:hypothetical protein